MSQCATSVTIMEELSPFIIMFAPDVIIYVAQLLVAKLRQLRHVLFLSFVVIYLSVSILYTVVPSLLIARNRERVITQFTGSSTTSTVVEIDQDEKLVTATHKETDESKRVPHRRSFSQRLPFHRLGSSFKMAVSHTRSKSIVDHSLACRISKPARRMSSHIVTAIHTISPRIHLHHARHNDENHSYFPEQPTKVSKAKGVAQTNVADTFVDEDVVREKEVVESEAELGNEELKAQPNIGSSSPKKPKAFKRIMRRASTALSFSRHS
ncbi:hypothetical protein H0H92_010559 [Tricholoma furcatifolium]|nr:hypothetical protein H0H92_010559 [Tricholoma furcatifolium]